VSGTRRGLIDRVCRTLAALGGLVLVAAAVVTVTSVLGRWLLARPIAGDIEIAALAMAVAISLFMPWCALRRGHVAVDVVTERAPPRVRARLDAFGSVAIAAIAAVLAWRMALGGIEMRAYGDESMVLRIPTWIGFVVAVPSFALLALAALVAAARAARGTGTGMER